MINFAGLINQARFIAELHQLHVINDEIEIDRHQVTPECWYFTSKVTRRAFQLKLIHNGEGCEIDYIDPNGVWSRNGVYDAEAMAARALSFLRGESYDI